MLRPCSRLVLQRGAVPPRDQRRGDRGKLAGIAEHATDLSVLVILGLLQCFSALVLAATLYAITREQDSDLAMLDPGPMASLGVLASAILVVGLPLRLAGLIHGLVTSLIWLPMLAFEVPLAVWLLTRGVATPARTRAA